MAESGTAKGWPPTHLRPGSDQLVHRLAYNGDVAASQLAVFQSGPSRTGGKVPISGLIRVKRATRKNSPLAAARRVAMKMGRRLRCSSVTYQFRYAPSYRQSGSDRLAGGPFWSQQNTSYFGDRTLVPK